MDEILCVWPGCEDDFDTEKAMKIHHKMAHGESIAKKSAKCSVCGEEFEFYESVKTGTLCPDCSDFDSDEWSYYMSNRENKGGRRPGPLEIDKKKEFVERIKSEVGCQRCGYSGDVRVLVFHHLNPEEKIGEVSTLAGTGAFWSDIYEEIKKCKVLCRNCHYLVHLGD